MQTWHNEFEGQGHDNLLAARPARCTENESVMKRCAGVRPICAALLVLGATCAGADPTDGLATNAVPTTAPSSSATQSQKVQLPVSSFLVPRGISSDDLPAHDDDFMHRAVTQKRVELVRFVDREDRRVFLGLSRNGYLGIQVQTRDHR
jgi:hypothetical protein